MHVTKMPVDRLSDLAHRHLAPGFASLGFRSLPTTFACVRDEVVWLLELETAPWSTSEQLSFTVSWGVYVPGLPSALGEEGSPHPHAWDCPVHGRVGERFGGPDARWFSVRSYPWPVEEVRPVVELLDARIGGEVLRLVQDEVLPQLGELSTAAAVQRHLASTIDLRAGAPTPDEVRRIRAVIGLSLLQGRPDNALRWIDYLEARSIRTIAPDVVAERLADLRRRCAS